MLSRSRCILAMCVIKLIKQCPLDRDPTIAMRFGALNQGRYNSILNDMCVIIDRWSARPRDRRVDFKGAADPTLLRQPRHLK